MPGHVNAIASKLQEPYATLVLFLAASGLRIGEAIAVKWSDFSDNVLHVTRRIYDGEVGTVKSDHSERKTSDCSRSVGPECASLRMMNGFSIHAKEHPSIQAIH